MLITLFVIRLISVGLFAGVLVYLINALVAKSGLMKRIMRHRTCCRFQLAYEADQNILNKIHLDLTPGSFNLMVGLPAQVSSTLLKAMAGLLL